MIFSIFSTFYYLRCSAHPRSKFEISKRMSRTWSSPSRWTLRNSISKGSIRSTRGCFCSSWRGRGTSLERSVNKFLSFSSLSKFNSFFFSYFSFPDECLIFHFFFFFFQADYDSDVVLRARKVYRDNDIYLNFERMKVKIRIGKAHLHLSNLFGGDTVLGKLINKLENLVSRNNSNYNLE